MLRNTTKRYKIAKHKILQKFIRNYPENSLARVVRARGIEGKILVAQYCRENKIPYLGLCYGMQIAVIEYARNVLKLKDAYSREMKENAKHKVIDILPEQRKKLENKDYGASMRLGLFETKIKKGTQAYDAYKKETAKERHRHRYEVNPEYVEQLENAGLVFSGKSPDGKLMEIVELPKDRHPFYLATQFHPEFLSRPLSTHPIFDAFIKSL